MSLARPCGTARSRTRPYPLRLSQSPGVLSTEFLLNFLPVGKDFTNLAPNFLRVGNSELQVSDFRLPEGILTPGRRRLKMWKLQPWVKPGNPPTKTLLDPDGVEHPPKRSP